MSDNVCCPYPAILDCADTDEHKHIACLGCVGDGPGVDNNTARKWCLGDFKNYSLRPKGDD